jgi:hypothetical protein
MEKIGQARLLVERRRRRLTQWVAAADRRELRAERTASRTAA